MTDDNMKTMMNVLPHTYGRFTTYVGQEAHFAPLLNFANFRPQRGTLQGCDTLRVERKINGQSIHAFKFLKRSVINKIRSIEF